MSTDDSIADFMKSLSDFSSRETTACPHCGEPVTALKQVGRCVYVRPCGCRLWQGTVPVAWQDVNGEISDDD